MGSISWIIIPVIGFVISVHGLSEEDLIGILKRLGKQYVKDGKQNPVAVINNAALAARLTYGQLEQAASLKCGKVDNEDNHEPTKPPAGCDVFERVAFEFLEEFGSRPEVSGDGTGGVSNIQIGELSTYLADVDGGTVYYNHVKETVPIVCQNAYEGTYRFSVENDRIQRIKNACNVLERIALEFMTRFYKRSDFIKEDIPWELLGKDNGVPSRISPPLISFDQVKAIISSICSGTLGTTHEQGRHIMETCTSFDEWAVKILFDNSNILIRKNGKSNKYDDIMQCDKHNLFKLNDARPFISNLCMKRGYNKWYEKKCQLLVEEGHPVTS